MPDSAKRRCLLVGLIVVVVLGAALPAHAGYDKLFRFKNLTTSNKRNVLATLNGLEVISNHYKANYYRWGTPVNQYPPVADDPTWSAVSPTEGIATSTAVYDTALFYREAGTQIEPGGTVKIGWSTADNNCRLRGLVWADSDQNTIESILDAYDAGDVPGGGTLTFDGTNYYWEIQNDTDGYLYLDYVEYQGFTVPFGTDDLGEVATSGVVGGLILALYQSVEAYALDFTDPSLTSLLGKLNDAAEYNALGFEYFGVGDEVRARRSWDAAIRKMESFVKELKTARDKDRIRDTEYSAWKAQADYIIELLSQPVPMAEPPAGYLPEGGIPPYIEPGDSFTLTIPAGDVQVGDGLIIHGSVVASDGTVLLDWVDQATVKSDLVSPTVTATLGSAGDVVNGWYDAPVTVTLESPDADVVGMIVLVNGVPVDGSGAPLDPLPSTIADMVVPVAYWQHTYATGVWEIAAVALDAAGNITDPEDMAIVNFGIDTAPPAIEAFISPPNLWDPDHVLQPMNLVINVTDDNEGIYAPTVQLTVTSNQPDNGGGDGDYPFDIQWQDENGEIHLLPPPLFSWHPDGCLYLRRERSGSAQETRIYTIYILATDVAGNTAEAYIDVPVAHDQGS